jgi:hypothetical protein
MTNTELLKKLWAILDDACLFEDDPDNCGQCVVRPRTPIGDYQLAQRMYHLYISAKADEVAL